MSKSSVKTKPFLFNYHSVRNISAPEDLENERKVYTGHAPAQSYIELPDHENVREYMLEAEGRKRRRPTQVHRAMRETLRETPQNFSILNSGIVIVASKVQIDDKSKTMQLYNPSLINGSQTQGELKNYLLTKKDLGEEPENIHVSFEIIEIADEDLVGEISISRNFQNDVMTISICGRLKQLDELDKSFQEKHPGKRLRKSETDLSEDHVFTEKLLQVITALIPAKLWLQDSEKKNPNKVYTYSMKARCLKDFQKIYEGRNSEEDLLLRKKYQDLYQFYLDIAGQAWELYEKWKVHPNFKGTGLRSIQRDENNSIKEVPDGLIFPILSALSAFAKKTKKGWKIVPPESFDDKELINVATSDYKEIANHNPGNMGKSRACYSSLYRITSIYQKLSKS